MSGQTTKQKGEQIFILNIIINNFPAKPDFNFETGTFRFSF